MSPRRSARSLFAAGAALAASLVAAGASAQDAPEPAAASTTALPIAHCGGRGIEYAFLAALSSEGRLFAAARNVRVDHTHFTDEIRLFETSANRLLRTLGHGHLTGSAGLDFAPDAGAVAVASALEQGGRVHVFDAATGAERACIEGKEPFFAVLFSPDGRTLAAVSTSEVLLLEGASGRIGARVAIERNGRSVEVAFSPDGRVLAIGDTALRLRDLEKNAEIPLGESLDAAPRAFSPDGERLVVSCRTPVSHDAIVAIPSCSLRVPELSDRLAGPVVFLPHGRAIISCADSYTEEIGALGVWDAVIGDRCAGPSKRVVPGSLLALSRDGKVCATGVGDPQDRRVFFYDVASGARLGGADQGYVESIRALTFAPGGALVSLDRRGKVRRWEAASGRFLGGAPLEPDSRWPVAPTAMSADGRRAATVIHGVVEVRDAERGEPRLTIRIAPQPGVFPPTGSLAPDGALAFSADGAQIAVGTGAGGFPDGRIRIYEASNGRLVATLGESTSPEAPAAITFAPGGTTLAAAFADTVRLYDLTKGIGASLPAPGICALAFSPDGRRIATGGAFLPARIYEAWTSAEPCALAKTGGVGALVFSPDGALVAVGGQQEGPYGRVFPVSLFDARSGHEVAHFIAHERPVTALAFSPDGKLLASGSEDGELLVWVVPDHR